MTAESAYRCFFRTYDDLEDNRQQQSKTRSQYQDLINQYRFSKDCGNQTSLVSTTSAGDKDPNDETVIDTGNGAIENAEENAEVSSKRSATHGNRKQPSIANSRSSRRRQIEEMELENLRAKKETEQQLRERQLELEQEREEIELRRQQEELRLQQQQQQQEQELRLRMQQQEDELRFRQHERALENERRKAEEEEEQRRLKLELTKGSSRASGSVADEIESVGSKRNQERIERWAEAGAQQSVPQRPLSPNVVIDPPTNVTKDRADKRFSTYPKTTPLFHPGERLFSTQLTEPSILKKPEVRKSIRVTDPPAPPLTRTTFQQQRTSAVQYRNRSQSPNNNFRNRSAESRNRSTMNHTTPQVIYQPVPSSGASGLPKLKLTEFSGDPLEWPEWSGLFDVVVHQKPISDTEKMQYLKTSLTGQAKAAISGMGFSSQSYYHAWDILCEKYGRSDFIVNAQFKKILTHPPVRHDDSTSIVKFANVVTNVVNTLTQLGYTSDLEAEAVLSSTTRKLSPQLREQWLQYMQDRRLLRGNLIIFKEWLASKSTIHENLLAQTNSSFDRNKFQSHDKPKTSTFASNAEESSKPKNFECPFKDGQHPIWTCEKFKSLKVNERREHVQKFRLCFNCLKPGHMSKDCRSRTCSVPSCGRRHNRLLHSKLPKKETTRNVSDATTAVATNITQGGLPVVRIKLTNRDLSLNVLAMCDSGSSISFVDKSVVSKLHLQGRKASLSVAGIHGSQDVKTEIVPIAVSAHEKSRPLTTVQFYVHEKLKLGDQIVELQELKDRYPHLRNLPDQSYNLNDVQVILGQDCYDIHHPFEFKKSEDKTAPWAVKSKIGWALNGPLPAKQAATLATTATSIADDKLANQLSKWWNIESYASNCDVTGHSKEEQRAIKTLEQTTRFNGERYEVGLLWREDEVKLPNNFYSAMGQLKSLERRLQKDEALKKRYQETIDTDVNAGYVRKVDQAELNETKDKLQWYLPHHPVINPHKPEKVRRVCNAAAKHQGVALNDKLLPGPDLLQSLIGIIFRFREHQIALSADIEAMFLQVAVPKDDSRCLRFLWREDPERRIEVYEYTRHVFGAKSSPTCANYALHQVAKDNAVNDENLVKVVQRNFYMDDFLKSVRTPQEAIEIYQKVRDILIKGGFKLTKWIASDDEVKSHIPETDRSTKVVKTFEAEPQSSSILGLNWNVDTDSLIVCRGTEQEVPAKITQRIVLSFVSAVFDPLGICSPFTIRMRFLLKSIWAEMGQAWDKELSAEHSKLFSDWCSELREIRTMSINRLYFENGCSNLRLHIFTDASEEAMCIVAYLQDEATLKLTYVIGKCRVAPIRHMTVPKLELQAAVYGVRLRRQVLNEHDVKIGKIYHWTDSSTVLQWLQAAHKKQQVFVANRAAEILENSSMDQWRHVKGVENPADIGTRGMSIEGLKESAWLNGPAWLQADEEKWPKPWCQVNELEPEQVTSTVATETKLEQLFDWRRYSSFKRIRNFIAYCMRFKTKQKGPLKADEIHQAEQILFRFVKNESFTNVSKSISNSKEISKVLNIAKLSPFIEEDGTIRVKGRLKHSNLDYNAKHPILLTAKHPVVQLLLEKAHRDNLHEGTEYVRNMLQQEYWIIGLRNALRKIKSRCIKCRHRNANPIHPPMADLPRERLDEHVFPFTHTGVDYFGPIEVKFLRRTLKRWCCLFTCLTTRAVHIEVAQSLDTESCLAAVTRFIARRGYPSTIISDNGTNFVGAAKELKAFMDEWDKAKIESDLAQKKIVWKFNPPGAPHFGGIWERLVQSCKKVMIAILDNRSLTDKVLSTTMCLVEQTLNARPLTAVSDDPEDLTALTPNHFLLGRENASAPFMPSSERYHDLRKSFKTAQAYADMIWKRWTREYLPQWNQRSKWSKEHVRNLKEGELGWMVDESVKRCEYKMGRVIQVFKGNDGVVRSARVKMAHGEFNRPVVKLAPVFYDGVSEIENRAGDVGATSEQKHEPSDQQK